MSETIRVKEIRGTMGAYSTVEVGTVTSVASTSAADVRNRGTKTAAILDFDIPKGKSAYETAQAGGYTGSEAQFTSDLAAVSSKYTFPANGIPSTDMSAAVQLSLSKADTALQAHQSLAAYRTSAAQDVIDAGKESSANKVTALSSASTDTQYPSAKCVYDLVGNIESLLAALR